MVVGRTFALSIVMLVACNTPARPVLEHSEPTPDRWVYRIYRTGLMPRPPSLETFTLSRIGDDAILEVESRTAELGTTAWGPSTKVTYSGVTHDKQASRSMSMTVSFAGHDDVALDCEHEQTPVAAATAVRVPDPSFHQECGNRGAFSPPTTTTVDAVHCKQPKNLELVFARAPGIELLDVDDDCTMQGSGLRAIPIDDSVMPIRPPD